jgi:winged helix DNA-binding protein
VAAGPAQVEGWIAELGDRLATVDLEGQTAYVPAEQLDDLAATRPSATVRFLGGFDQWVLGPGTDDPHVIASHRRTDVSRTAGWIAPIVVRGGVVTGTWAADGGSLRVAWFREAGKPPATKLKAETKRLGGILGRELSLVVEVG